MVFHIFFECNELMLQLIELLLELQFETREKRRKMFIFDLGNHIVDDIFIVDTFKRLSHFIWLREVVLKLIFYRSIIALETCGVFHIRSAAAML